MKKFVIILILLFIICQLAAEDYKRHGLLLEVGTGIGYQSIKNSSTYVFEGFKFPSMSFRVGYTIGNKLALYIGNTTCIFFDSMNMRFNTDFTVQMALGVRYYFENCQSYYIAAETGLKSNVIHTMQTLSSDTYSIGGPVINFIIGYEINPNIELEFEYSIQEDKDRDDVAEELDFNIVFHL